MFRFDGLAQAQTGRLVLGVLALGFPWDASAAGRYLVVVTVGGWRYVAWQPTGTSVSVRVGPGSLTLAGGF